VLLTRLLERQPLSWVGLGPRRAGIDLLWGLITGTAWLLLSLGVTALGRVVFLDPARGVAPLPVLAFSGLVVGLNAANQELAFRGYLFQIIRAAMPRRPRLGDAVSVLGTSVLFSAAHFNAFGGAVLPAVNVLLAGVLLGVARLRSGGLWLPTAMHVAWNFLLGPGLGLAVSGKESIGAGSKLLFLKGPAILTGGEFGLEAGIGVTVVTAAWIWVVWRSFRPPAGAAAV